MLPDTSTQTWMFVSTRLLRGSSHDCGPARITMTSASTSAGSVSALRRKNVVQLRLGAVAWSSGSATALPRRVQTQATIIAGITSRNSTDGVRKYASRSISARLHRELERVGRQVL